MFSTARRLGLTFAICGRKYSSRMFTITIR
jgi:hypothetical protein